ncbi:hypothetical protein HPB48_014897 [Haemaphysalis longicornis]|uniref:FMN hydroxy acid dehydrogenase domain-containing protein n=1 Tax=Haemaphysalis longicornis TaxID=44386 RepID=A0A9J6GDS2_HAELO|nr:hypothetical protein HPB48_014897 [Haemaphysalis longicornis]
MLMQLDALPDVVRAVAGRCDVYMDGGVRSGTDVVKALCLGAKAVFIGRPTLYGLGYKGEAGVIEVLEGIKRELDECLALLGKNIFTVFVQKTASNCGNPTELVADTNNDYQKHRKKE